MYPDRQTHQIEKKHSNLSAFAGRIAAVALLGALAGSPNWASLEARAQHSPVPITELVPASDKLEKQEETYPPIISSEYAAHTYDKDLSNKSIVVYEHKGLEGLSFVRPALEVSRQILEADNIKSIENSATPFFKSLGMKLYLTEPHPLINNTVRPVSEADLEETRMTLLSTMNEISITPREVIKLAGIKDVVFGHELVMNNGKHAEGLAYTDQGIMAFDTGLNSLEEGGAWHHELGHHIDKAINKVTEGRFRVVYSQLNPDWFVYKDQAPEEEVTNGQFENQRQAAVDTLIIEDPYSAESISEDVADLYNTLWSGWMAPSPDDTAYKTPVGAKRVLLVETINGLVPGFRKYMIGLSSTAKYRYEKVPYSLKMYKFESEHQIR